MTSRWTNRQLKEIQLHIFFFLTAHLDRVIESFLSVDGTKLTLSFLRYAIETEQGRNQSKDFHADYVDMIPACLRFVLALCETGSLAKKLLAEQGIFDLVLGAAILSLQS